MKLDAKVDTLTKEVAKGGASSETKQLLLWLLELQVFREQESTNESVFTVATEGDNYVVDINCSQEDFINILDILALEMGKHFKNVDNTEDFLNKLNIIFSENFREGVNELPFEELN